MVVGDGLVFDGGDEALLELSGAQGVKLLLEDSVMFGLLQGFGGGLAVGEACGALTGAAAALGLLPQSESKSRERYIDFHQDAAMIRSAFFRIGVDLTRDHIHIQQFLELLADLPKDTALMRTVKIRARPIPKPTKNNAEEIAALQAAKARVAIHMSEEERMARFAESLKNSSVLRG